jgi:hypothetical protein
MAKRFIDTGLFDDPWFMDLSQDGKLFYIYLFTRCNHAGIIQLNDRLCQFQTGVESLTTVKQELGNRLIMLPEGYYFLPNFIRFQYPNFPNSNVKQQTSAIEILKKFKLYDNSKGTVREDFDKDSDNDNDSEDDSDNDNDSEDVFVPPTKNNVVDYFKTKGYSVNAASKAYDHYESLGWKDSKGKQVNNWKNKMVKVWFTPENKDPNLTAEGKPKLSI